MERKVKKKTWLRELETNFRVQWIRENNKKNLLAAELLSSFDVWEARNKADYGIARSVVPRELMFRRDPKLRTEVGLWSERLSDEALAAIMLASLPGHYASKPHHELYARWAKLPPEKVLKLIRYAWGKLSEEEKRRYVKKYVEKKGKRAREELLRYIGEEALRYLERLS